MKIQTLKNDLRFAIDKMQDVQTVSIGVFVGTGSRNEDENNNGISHFLEHMAFKGTNTRNAIEIAEQFDDIGGRINAYTSKEKTVYYVKILKEDLEFAIEFLSDIIQNPTFDETEIERERGVILQELSMINDTPDDIIYDYFSQTAYPDQASGRSIIGSVQNIKKFNKQDFQNYISNQYNYSNIAVAISGNVDEEKSSKLIEKYFNNLSNKQPKKYQKSNYQGGIFSKEKDLEQLHLLIGFKGTSYLDDDFYTSQITSTILGGSMSSILFQEIREKLGLAYSIYAFNNAYDDCGYFAIYSAIEPNNANKYCQSIKKILQSSKIDEKQLKRAKNQLKAGILMSQENTNSRCQKIGSNILSYNKIIDQKEIIEKINSINLKNVKEYLQKTTCSSTPTISQIGKIANQDFLSKTLSFS